MSLRCPRCKDGLVKTLRENRYFCFLCGRRWEIIEIKDREQ